MCLLLAAAPVLAGEGKTVNVNTATAAELQLLPRIGPSVAARIVEQREKNGAFKSLDDLMLVRGIGESTYEQLKPYVALCRADDAQREGEAAARAEVRHEVRRQAGSEELNAADRWRRLRCGEPSGVTS